MASWNNIEKFDFTTEEKVGVYWKESEFDFFVDTTNGDDSNAGTSSAPFKTLSKVKSLGTSYWKAGVKIAVSGIINEPTLTIDANIHIIGCGGYDGKTMVTVSTIQSYITVENCLWYNFGGGNYGGKTYNSIFVNFYQRTVFSQLYSYFCLYISYSSNYFYVYGNNNTFYNDTNVAVNISGNNNHVNNSYGSIQMGSNNLINTNTRYYTDATKTTAAELYSDPSNYDFGLKKDVNIYDATTSSYITVNPLIGTGKYSTKEHKNLNIGAGNQTFSFTALDDERKSTDDSGEATYSNLESDTNGFTSRISDSSDGTLESGIYDLGDKYNIIPRAFFSYTSYNNAIVKTMTSVDDSTGRQRNTFQIKIGNTVEEVNSCPWLTVEYGKKISFSGSGVNRKGNGDDNFNVNDARTAKFQYCKTLETYKTLS